MKKILILGTGCAKCKTQTTNVESAVRELGLEAAIEKVEDIQEIMKYGVMSTPAIIVDGEVKVTGKIVSVEEVKALLK